MRGDDTLKKGSQYRRKVRDRYLSESWDFAHAARVRYDFDLLQPVLGQAVIVYLTKKIQHLLA